MFLRTWYPVDIPSYYNPVTSLLLPLGNKTDWLGMRTVSQLRKETGTSAPNKEDSHYKVKFFAPVFSPHLSGWHISSLSSVMSYHVEKYVLDDISLT